MSLTTEPSVQTYVRPRARDFGDLPLDTVELLDVMSGLTSLQLGVYMRLRASLWLRGSLPVGLKALAAIAQVTPRTFERMAPCLAPLFDHGADGRWHDHALEKKRGSRAVLEVEERAVDPGLSAKRSAAGKRGQEVKRSLRLVTSDADDASAQANERPFASKTDEQNDGDFAATGGPVEARFAAPSASPPYGSIDRSFIEPSSKTNDRSIRASVGAHDGEANAAAPLQANESANLGRNGQANDPSKPGEPAASAMPARSLAEVDEAALIAALRDGGGGKIPAVLLNAGDLAPLSILVAEGCELERDVLPAVLNFARGCTGPLRTFAAKPIREKAVASRDTALRARAQTQTAVQKLGAFVVEGTPAWRAWLRYKGVKSHFAFTKDDDRSKRGFYHPSPWPPGWDEARLTHAEQDVDRP